MFYFLIPIVVLTIFFFWIAGSYNRLVQVHLMAQEAWSGIDVQLKRRYDLIPNLIETVKGYSLHEKNIVADIVHMRALSMGAQGIADKESAEVGLTQSLKTLFAIAEQYPNLKANENFLALQKDLSLIEDELSLSRRYYNGAVRNYNTRIVQFPSNLIAKGFGFMALPYFEIADSNQRNAPNVKF